MPRAEGRCPGLSAGQAAASSAPHALSLLLLLLLACCANACRGMPTSPQRLQQEKELQLWNEINEACSSFLSIDSQPQAFVALRELCRVVMEIFQKPQRVGRTTSTYKHQNADCHDGVCNLSVVMRRQDEGQFKAGLGYVARVCLKTQAKQQNGVLAISERQQSHVSYEIIQWSSGKL
nr:neuromedin-U [Meriones unguiculatus]